MEMSGMTGLMGGWMLLWGAVGIALLTLIVVVTIHSVRNGSGSSQVAGPRVEDELYSRYSAGLISGDEYQRLSTALGRSTTRGAGA
ncbi:MAG: hypothetical protein ACRDQB_00440 [Thermocrispum sp.]